MPGRRPAIRWRAVESHEARADAGYDTGLTLFDDGHRLPLQVTIAQIRKVAGD